VNEDKAPYTNFMDIKRWQLPPGELERIFEDLKATMPDGEDPWGVNLDKMKQYFQFVWPMYKHYFKVELHGQENLVDQNFLVVSNHSGQIAIDGMLITTAFATELKPPRLLRAMVERFFIKLPFVNKWAQEGGAVLGDRQNCLNLLEKGNSILVFPEGVPGVAKNTSEFYHLQNFTNGFIRMALKAKVNILPVAVVGAEEYFPYVYQAKHLAKFFKVPALPLSMNYVPLPSPTDIYIGKPIILPSNISDDASDEVIAPLVEIVKKQIQEMINIGLEKRRPSPIHDYLKEVVSEVKNLWKK
jgi:1-acyl-sn-glycerol-3-phosphate acyltransferase